MYLWGINTAQEGAQLGMGVGKTIAETNAIVLPYEIVLKTENSVLFGLPPLHLQFPWVVLDAVAAPFPSLFPLRASERPEPLAKERLPLVQIDDVQLDRAELLPIFEGEVKPLGVPARV